MRRPFWDRMREHLCRWFGHREVISRYDVCCSRCRLLLRGPLNMTDADKHKIAKREGIPLADV